MDRLLDNQLDRTGLSGDDRQQAYDTGKRTAMSIATSPWFRYFMTTDPAQFLRRVQCPVLALNGTLDLQVDVDQNLPPIEAALAEAGNDDVTTHRLDKLNHLFQTAQTGSVAEYGQIEETVAPEVLELMAAWITARVGG